MFHLDFKKPIIYEPEDFESPVVCYIAMQFWMQETGEDFFDQMQLNFNGINFFRYLIEEKELSEEIVYTAAFDKYNGSHADIANVVWNQFKYDSATEEKLFQMITDKIYQLFARYVSNMYYKKLYDLVTSERYRPHQAYVFIIEEEDAKYWEREYHYLSKIHLMEEINNENSHRRERELQEED